MRQKLRIFINYKNGIGYAIIFFNKYTDKDIGKVCLNMMTGKIDVMI